jgi:acetoin utilization deacetylase AcuC-like enzyme
MAPAPVFLDHPSSLEHLTGGHPERPERIVAVLDELARRGWLGYERMSSPLVSRSVLSAVHPEEYVAAIERAAARGGGALDADTVISEGSFAAAMHACGGAVSLVERLVAGGAGARGFSAHRPPGHHALPSRAMGFCLFGNVAVAVRFALDHLGLRRVMVLDWDVHHGNGTSDVFAASDEVLFVSIHEWPLYPGTGAASDVGHGRGRGFNVNLPVPAGSGDAVYVSLVADVAVPLARAFAPELVLISAGFDAHVDDPLASCRVTEDGFAAMTAAVVGVCDELGVGLGCVLEGGYSLAALARSVAATMEAMVGGALVEGTLVGGALVGGALFGSVGEAGERPHPLATAALARLTPLWPALAGG